MLKIILSKFVFVLVCVCVCVSKKDVDQIKETYQERRRRKNLEKCNLITEWLKANYEKTGNEKDLVKREDLVNHINQIIGPSSNIAYYINVAFGDILIVLRCVASLKVRYYAGLKRKTTDKADANQVSYCCCFFEQIKLVELTLSSSSFFA